jgi:hypothetical protein
METIKEVYGAVDNLSGFTHPVYGPGKFMSDRTLLWLAGTLAQKIESSGIRQVIVSETGARPLAYVCEKILQQRDVSVDWTYMKFPRESVGTVYPLLMFYLTEDEKTAMVSGMERQEALRKACLAIPSDILSPGRKPLDELLVKMDKTPPHPLQEKIADIMKGTKIAGALEKSFLYLDEYVDSGTTLQNAAMHFNLFVRQPDFKILSYCVHLPDTERFDKIASTIFDKDDEQDFFEAGAYPFENRIDLIGYFYLMNGQTFRKIAVDEMRASFEDEHGVDPSRILQQLKNVVRGRDLLGQFRQQFTLPEVRHVINEGHVIRQYLHTLEEESYGKSEVAEFFWQLADMYGPIWSPMPKQNHLDFFRGTELSRPLLLGVEEFEQLSHTYKTARQTIIKEAAEVCLERKNAWYERIDCLLEGKNGSWQNH